MIRYVDLACVGEIIFLSSERCPECDSRPRYVEVDEYDERGRPIYTCRECGIDWAVVNE